MSLSSFLSSLYFWYQSSMFYWQKIFIICRVSLCTNDDVLFLIETFQFYGVSFTNCWSYCLHYWYSVLYVFSSVNGLKIISHFVFYQVQFIWFCVILNCFMQGNKYKFISIILQVTIQFDEHQLIVENVIFQCVFLAFSEKWCVLPYLDLCLDLQLYSIDQQVC